MEGGSTAVKADGETQTTQKSYYPREGAISMLTPQIGINLSTITGDGQTSDSNGGLTAGVTMDLGRGNLVFWYLKKLKSVLTDILTAPAASRE